jgi:hypothetical protein
VSTLSSKLSKSLINTRDSPFHGSTTSDRTLPGMTSSPGSPAVFKRSDDADWALLCTGRRQIKPWTIPKSSACATCWAFGESRPRLQYRLYCNECDSRYHRELYAKEEEDKQVQFLLAATALAPEESASRLTKLEEFLWLREKTGRSEDTDMDI